MHTVLDTAHTWFMDSIAQEPSGALMVRLVEGIKGEERQFVEVGETALGPYFPVRVEAGSRCVEVSFPNAHAFFVCNESFDKSDPALKKKGEGRFLYVADASSFRTSSALSSDPPVISLMSHKPDLAIERTYTWSAS